MRLRLPAAAFVVLATVLVPSSIRAEPVRIAFEMTLSATFGDPADMFGAPTQPGDRIRGSFSYDPSAPDLLPDDPRWGLYRPEGTIAFAVPSMLAIPVEVLSVVDHAFPVVDSFEAIGTTATFPGFDYVQTELRFRTSERAATALPVTAAEFARVYSDGFFFISALQLGGNPPFDSGTHEFRGTLRVLEETAPVPEPATLLLVAGGLGVLGRRRWTARPFSAAAAARSRASASGNRA